jgi:antitoxin component YwqK of YwqJK toxin-antitoxin module
MGMRIAALAILSILARPAHAGSVEQACAGTIIGTWKLVDTQLVKVDSSGKIKSSKPYDFKKHFKKHEMSFWDHDYGQVHADYVKKKSQKKFKPIKEFRYKIENGKLRMDVKKEKATLFHVLEMTDEKLVLRDVKYWWLTELFMVTTWKRVSCKPAEYTKRTWTEKDFYSPGPPEVDYSKLKKKWGKYYYNVVPYTGTAIRYQKDGSTFAVMDFKDGLLHGPNIQWYPGNKKQFEGQWLNGKKEGDWTQWYESGQPASKEQWSKSKKHGTWTLFYPDGQKKFLGTYSMGRKNGPFSAWDKTGQQTTQELWVRDMFLASFDPSLGIPQEDLLATLDPALSITDKGLKHGGPCSLWPWSHVGDGLMASRCRCIAADGSGNTILGLSKKLLNYPPEIQDKHKVLEVWKWSDDGKQVWSSPIIASYSARIDAVTTDAAGNSIIAGLTSHHELTIGEFTLTSLDKGRDVFVASLDPDGTPLWAHRFEGAGNEELSGIATDPSGNVIVLGRFESPTLTLGATTLKNPSGWRMFIAKIDPQGKVLWARKATGSTDPDKAGMFPTSAVVDADGNIYATGGFRGAKTRFGKKKLKNPGDTLDIFLVKYDPSGKVRWAKSAGGKGSDIGNDLAIDPNGSIILVGSYGAQMKLGSFNLAIHAKNTSSEAFVARFDSKGKATSAVTAHGTSIDQAHGVSTDAEGNLYVNIRSTSPALTLSDTVVVKNEKPSKAAVLVKYDPSLRPLWAMRVLKEPACFCKP